MAPRMMARPSVRFSSVSTVEVEVLAPGAPEVLDLRLTLRNSSVSARTRFMCCEDMLVTAMVGSGVVCPDLIKCQHLSNQLSSIIHGDSHAVVDLEVVSTVSHKQR